MKVLYLNTDDKELKEMEIEDDLDVYYNLINCSCIDIVTRKIGDKNYDFIVDDEGLFKPKPRISALDFNNMDDGLVGNLIITGTANEEGELTSLTDSDILNIKTKTHKMMFEDGFYPIIEIAYPT